MFESKNAEKFVQEYPDSMQQRVIWAKYAGSHKNNSHDADIQIALEQNILLRCCYY